MESTVDKFHGTICAYINRAIKLDLFPMDKNPYIKFKRKRPKYVDRKYLTADELAKIEAKEFTIARVGFVRDMFLFCCYTGLSYADLQLLKPSNLVNESGTLFIKTFREKTDEKAAIFVFEKARRLLEKYKGKRSGYCFPGISNQRFNSYLKEVADLSGVDKNLTVHMARHTFATTVMLQNGASLEVVQKALGHAKIATTEIYAKMVDSRVAAEMGGIEKKMKGA
jgi:site-specific recombinase XerD